MRKIFLLFTLLFAFAAILYSQEDKAQLEKERLEIQKEIKEIQDAYDKLKGQKKQVVSQYNLLDRKIKLQNRYIANINKELRLIDDGIYLSNMEIYRMSRQLDTLKAQYARSVVYAYKNRSNYDFLNFIFSASNFNDAIKRVAYLKSYRSYREQQVNTIKETQEKIAKRKEEQLVKKSEKDEALKNQTVQVKVLDVQKKEKDVVLSSLKSKEKEFEKQLAAKRKRDRDLKNAIDAIVKKVIDAEKKKAALESGKNAKPEIPVTPGTAGTIIKTKPESEKTIIAFNSEADLKLNSGFETNRGRIPWPVDQGYVCTHFGSYQIENTKLKGDNAGITICTTKPGLDVKSVFDGEVVAVFNVGDVKAVMVRHGKYFTVYSNLSTANTAKGNTIKTGQVIGKVGADEDDGEGGKLEFVLMIENKNVNPEPWLRK
jgi:septal ring factor EnvC (AmiA/AmiB activator)